MSQYIVSARKYRPDTFETLIGQDNIAQTLKNSILRGQLAHAYLFCGPRGVGKTSTARIFAKAINCSNPGADMEPCGECESCLSFKEGRSYCIHELDAASNNGVDDIKALMDQVQVPPQVGKYSVYIIDEVHMLTQQAFNAFLKTLEEPPAHAIFILATTEKHKILPTILSRCQTYDFNRIAISDIVRNLRGIALKEGVAIDDESLHIIAQKADGAMRDALTIFDQTVAFCGSEVRYEDVLRNLNVLDYEYSFAIVSAALKGDYATCFKVFDEVLAKGFNAQYFVSALSSHLRDIVVSKTAGLDSLLNLPDSLRKRYSEQADQCSIKFLYDALGVTTACEAGYKASINQRLHIEFALMRLCFLNQAPAAAQATAPRPAPAAPAPQPVAAPAPKPAPAPEPKPAPAPEPQPAPIPKPEPAPAAPAAPSAPASSETAAAPARRRPRPGASLAISELMNEGAKEEKVETKVVEEQSLPSEEKLRQAWPTLARRYSSSPRLYNALMSASLSVAQVDGRMVLTFMVDNEAQRSWIQSAKMMDMQSAFSQILSSTKVGLAVEAAPVDSFSDLKYTPEEKAKDLIEKNPEVGKFVKEFSLDV